MRVISYGGGVQSTAMIVLAAQGKLGPVTDAIFANVGDDSEHPATLAYVRDVMTPWAAARGITVHELARKKRDGTTETLMGRMLKANTSSTVIPIRMSNGAPGNRSCTIDFKVRVLAKWHKAHGATPANPATSLIGISLDEVQRVGRARSNPREIIEYPLIDLRLTRQDCKRVISEVGLPVPGKSSCFFCPFHRPAMWATMRRDEPELFQRAADLEVILNRKRDMLKKDHVWLTRFNKPLAEAIPTAQPMLRFDEHYFDAERCDEGACWT